MDDFEDQLKQAVASFGTGRVPADASRASEKELQDARLYFMEKKAESVFVMTRVTQAVTEVTVDHDRNYAQDTEALGLIVSRPDQPGLSLTLRYSLQPDERGTMYVVVTRIMGTVLGHEKIGLREFNKARMQDDILAAVRTLASVVTVTV